MSQHTSESPRTQTLAPKRTHSATLDEEVQSLVFPSGLTVLFCPKPGFKKKYACYSTFYGSVDSEFLEPSGSRLKVPDGIAHFLEHSLFETEEGNVSDLFAKKGTYNNASTSFTTTTYLFASTSRFFENLELLLGFVENPVFRPEKVEKEKGIIEQEIRGYEDNPGWVSYMGLLENLFEKHPMRIDIAGTAETIGKIDSETLHRCFQAFYSPSNMILFVVGDVDPAELFGFVAEKSRFASAPPRVTRGVERIYPEEPRAVFRPETRKEMEVALPKLLLGFKEVGVPDRGDDFVLQDLATELALEILFGKSSNTFRDLYESQMVLDDFGAFYSIGAGVGYGVVGGDTPKPDELKDLLLGKLSSLIEKGIDAEAFERGKRRFMGSFIRSFNSLEYIASHYTYFRFHDFDLFRSIDLLARIDRETLEERVRTLLDPANHASFVVLPK
ncbi:MAG TPA: pitrilysin family protein [Planctomycetota bacterium]|nr:pitrilysin family protein [Planctomycetota bacterium]